MEPLSNYYFDPRGYFVLRNKVTLRLKILSMVVVFILACGYSIELSAPKPTEYTIYTYKYEQYIKAVNPKISTEEIRNILKAMYTWSKDFGVDIRLLLALSNNESKFDKYAISQSGAYGIMQVIPVWHKDKIKDARNKLGNPEVFNINTNIYIGTRVLSDCLRKTLSVAKALQCYSGNTPGYSEAVLAEFTYLKGL